MSGDSGSAISAFWSRTAERTRVMPKPWWSINNNKNNKNNRHKDHNSKNRNNSGKIPPQRRGRRRHAQWSQLHSSSAVQTCCAPTTRQLHQPQHSTRSGQQQLCQPQGTNKSKNGARNRARRTCLQFVAKKKVKKTLRVLGRLPSLQDEKLW